MSIDIRASIGDSGALATVAEDYQTAGTRGTSRVNALHDYEGVRREALRKYNSLLLDAQGRLQAALKRVEQEQMEAEAESVRELTGKIHELIEYLGEAKL
jgi:hypothetical protein